MAGYQRSLQEVRRLQAVKTAPPADADPLGAEMVDFFKRSVARRQSKFARLAECWITLIPSALNEHCALATFSKGTLTVIVDSSPHLYELKQLLLAGLESQLLFACRSSGLRKVTLKPGRWYEGDAPEQRRVMF